MKKEVDARNQDCPKPVIMTKKALDSIDYGIITTLVDNEVAKENVSKLARSSNFEYTVDKTNEGDFLVSITKGEVGDEEKVCIPDTFKDITVAISSDKMGKGNDELGSILIKGFIYTLTEAVPYPATILFYNSGVKLTTEGSEVLQDLKKLEAQGVEILSCGTCLDFFNIKDKLKVGEISNMYTIVEKLKNTSNTINI
ncbi:sulfurtransferase-like selenium metabolism protein YedF [Clostridiisalibacter paucivorans]|uniref:sulfurtransferase-like selenium metabolism protein YedF n=1 Tax=Clostridiisalibacter paucivorans TaxID=408753 RepID=UPI00047C5880|nr:sulfurtransferase-like selenium metabolism protein YedF [Clostridiisalibacter paucivorans]